jgi:hypothetical protein
LIIAKGAGAHDSGSAAMTVEPTMFSKRHAA